ncbi:hypothetical protein JG688_00018628 [Phytophthora aleatoria]|uniref:Helitron helicase-like domain-containing protein n=1 Tax=Phytophthora aleatoria TaxID=2496075 RepID=A0A8J5LUI2_9STRA|nr:hypothetical protein JG688_00018628 [Phytophthora aleatoria]
MPSSNMYLELILRQGKECHFEGYLAMVETQGRGTLHIHLLIWLNNCPLNSTVVERLLDSTDGNRFREQVASYARIIATNNLPIAINKCGCSECVAPFSDIVELPIPDSARKDPVCDTGGKRARVKPTEPALLQCSSALIRFRQAAGQTGTKYYRNKKQKSRPLRMLNVVTP